MAPHNLFDPQLILVSVSALVALPSLYLGFLALVTLVRRQPTAAAHSAAATPFFAVLVPAHNEERVIGGTVKSIRGVDYPADRFAVHVVADNCTDMTASVARRSGACVHIRHDAHRRGKGAALNWLRAEVDAESRQVDAYVVVDADTELSVGFLRAMARHLATGAAAVQALNLVAGSLDLPLVRIRELAFRLVCHLRPLAFVLLGGSSGLHGNGMCFSAGLLGRYRWSETSVAEDGELFVRLMRDRHRVALAVDATARSVMPVTFGEARAQAVRWERGRFDHAVAAAQLVAAGVRARDANQLIAGTSAFIPPISILAAANVTTIAIALIIESRPLSVIAGASVVALLLYLWRGAALSGLSLVAMVRILMWLPLYAAWKIWIVALAAAGAGRGEWSQTTRRI